MLWGKITPNKIKQVDGRISRDDLYMVAKRRGPILSGNQALANQITDTLLNSGRES
jgi:hypothetical protein